MFGGTHRSTVPGWRARFKTSVFSRDVGRGKSSGGPAYAGEPQSSRRDPEYAVLPAGGKRRLDRAFYWLEVVDLVDCANRPAGEMSYGQQRRLEIARAMCTGPEMICLDEPAAGLTRLKRIS